jgi:hypothetical protein
LGGANFKFAPQFLPPQRSNLRGMLFGQCRFKRKRLLESRWFEAPYSWSILCNELGEKTQLSYLFSVACEDFFGATKMPKSAILIPGIL